MGRQQEMYQQHKYHQAWETSKKHSKYMVDSLTKCHNHYELVEEHYKQYLSELTSKHIIVTSDKNYIQVWETALNTANKNTDIEKIAGGIRLLHQTSIQRSNN